MRYEVNAVIHSIAVFFVYGMCNNAPTLVVWPMQISSAGFNAEIVGSVLFGRTIPHVSVLAKPY